MEKLKRLVNHLLITTALLVTSCGYVSDKPVQNIDVYKADELQQPCTIDVSKLAEIFKADQQEQIRCLQENFVQFTKYVRSKHPGTVTEAELSIFVRKFFKGQSEAIIKGLSLIFQLNMILLKDEADRISHSKISPLFELLVKLNQEAVTLTTIIKEMDERGLKQQKFWELRESFNRSTNRFANSAIGVIENSPGIGQKLNMREFILDLSKKIGDQGIDSESINSYLFLKKVLVGGDREIITSDELKNMIRKLPTVLGLIFDIYFIKGENFKSDTEEIKFYLDSAKSLHQIIEFKQNNFELLNSSQLVDIAKKFLKDYNVESFKPSIEALKVRFIGGKKDSFTLTDLNVSFGIVLDFFERAYFTHVTYADPVNTYILSRTGPVSLQDLPFKKLPEYDFFNDKKRLDTLFASFTDIAVNFRYFREKATDTALYDTRISRNKTGFLEVNITKWLSWKLLKAYGHVDKAGNMQISMDEFSKFLLDSRPLLEEFKLWSPNFKTFSRNALLLADLFQQQSNGDQLININEATEYIGMLLTAVTVSGKVNDSLTNFCDTGINKDDPVYDVNCYNHHFYNVVLEKLSLKSRFPKLNSYFRTATPIESLDYLKGVEGFARDNNAPGVPVNRRDSTLIIGAMLNIETTFIRFDKNNDNIIDYNELSEAFVTYRPSIISIANLKPEQEQYAKGIFLYMVSKMEIPKTGTWVSDIKFSSFNACVQSETCRNVFLDPIEAKRLNIGKLLYYMVNQNPDVTGSTTALKK